jgi:hypothetical protein
MTTDHAGSAPQREPTSEHQPRDVVRHVLGCGPCDGRLDTLKLQGDVLGYLGGRGSDAGETALVEGVLGRAAAVGQRELEDTLYEMARSALILVPHVQRSRILYVKPPSLMEGAERLSALKSRGALCQGGERVGTEDLTPSPAEALSLAGTLGEILSRAEAVPARGDFIRAHVALESGSPSDAALSFGSIVDANGAASPIGRHAQVCQMHSLIAGGRFQDVVELSESASESLSKYPAYWVNLATAYAKLGDRPNSEDALRSYRATAHSNPLAVPPLKQVGDEIKFFASALEKTADQVRELMGVA